MDTASEQAFVDLYWLPLGSGAPTIVRYSGILFEALAARYEHRRACDLYHSALRVGIGDDRYVIEMAPVWSVKEADRGVVREGPVGMGWLGRLRMFRYEVRRWRHGVIPDIDAAVASPQRLSADAGMAGRIFDLVPRVPVLVWGRDELGTGDMWNSNSLISWLLASSEHDIGTIKLPPRGRAPGWDAGLAAAAALMHRHWSPRLSVAR